MTASAGVKTTASTSAAGAGVTASARASTTTLAAARTAEMYWLARARRVGSGRLKRRMLVSDLAGRCHVQGGVGLLLRPILEPLVDTRFDRFPSRNSIFELQLRRG